MKLIHYSAKPLVAVKSRAQEPMEPLNKPCGLWVSVEGPDDWLEWCRAESWCTQPIKHATEVVLSSNANILHLSSGVQIDDFTAEWGRPYPGTKLLKLMDWPGLARQYQGLIIAPYQWSRRLAGHTRWYYGWDCASGCIWDAAAVADLKPCEIRQLTEEAE